MSDMSDMSDMSHTSDWRLRQLTHGSQDGIYHSHSYYDIPVFDADSRYLVAHRLHFVERPPTPGDTVQIGLIDTAGSGDWTTIGESRAWSWQQGPLAQWIDHPRRVVWNDRQGTGFVARVYDPQSGAITTLPAPVYAVDPAGGYALSLNMARLDAVRPGYGYCGGSDARLHQRRPRQDGVWRMDLQTGECRLVLSLHRAVNLLRRRLPWRQRYSHLRRRYHYWFNHAKISPDGARFTVKLRFRTLHGGWNDRMGVSLTCGTDGNDLRLLAGGTSHVIWLDNQRLYGWQQDGVHWFDDRSGERYGVLAPALTRQNVHIRHLPTRPELFVLDTPYRREIDLLLYDDHRKTHRQLARFAHHRPERGQFRCDLHPCPSPDGRKIVVTSLHDGGRQVYLLSR